VAVNSSQTRVIESLTERELSALLDGATWYAKYHQQTMADRADDRSAAAVIRREHFHDLHTALAKLGVRIRRPLWLEPG
jgi:hypothetical protein